MRNKPRTSIERQLMQDSYVTPLTIVTIVVGLADLLSMHIWLMTLRLALHLLII